MSLARQLRRGLASLANSGAADREVAAEVAHHLAEATAEYEAAGLSRHDAARAARIDMGGALHAREQVRSSTWEYHLGVAFADLRHAARRLRAAPAFTAVVVFTLALGIGGTTAMFSAIYPILIAPLPYPEADRIVAIVESGLDGSRVDGTFAMYRSIAGRGRSLDAVAVIRDWQPSLTEAGEPERLAGQRVSWAYFRALGVTPAIGRDFIEDDDRFRGPNVTILSHTLWLRHFGADPAIVGREIRLDDNLFTVVGIMPASFENTLAPAARLWAPLQYDASLPSLNGREWGHHLRTIGRLRPGVAVEQATAEVSGIARSVITERRPASYDPNTQVTAIALERELTRGVRPALVAIVAAVALVLVIVCVNVTNLLLVRSVQRRPELALRAALGAGRARLIRQMMIETMLLATLGGLAGIVVARLGVDGLMWIGPSGLPRPGDIRVDVAAFVFCAVLTTLVGLVSGLTPAAHAARNDPRRDLQDTSRRTGDGHRSARSVLVVTEVALAVMLLIGSGLLTRSLIRLLAVPSGFNADSVLTLQLQIVGHRFDPPAEKHRFFAQALDSVRAVPGVLSAGLTSQLPLSGDRDEYGVQFEDTPTGAPRASGVFRYAVSPGYLETMQIPLVSGRTLDARDGANAPRVALISESLANARFKGNALGQRLRVGPAGPFTIVGVVGDVKQVSLAASDANAVYISSQQSWFVDNPLSVVVRFHGDATALSGKIREAIWALDRSQPVARIATMETLLSATAAGRRFSLLLVGLFAVTALVLAAAGIYGVIAASVASRTREIGVRAALGASARAILGLVLRQGLTLTACGVFIGMVAAAVATRFMVAFLFGISPLDTTTYAFVLLLTIVVALIACSVPAWRALKVHPACTLRAE